MIFAPVDIAFILLAIIIIIRSALRGFVDEIMGLAWVSLGLIFSIRFYKKGAQIIREKFLLNVEYLPEILSFIALILIVFIIVRILTIMLKDIINRVQLAGLDCFLGAIFGIIESVAVIALIIFIIGIQPLFDKAAVLKNSVFYHILKPVLALF
ncbi:MAG: CvpA family protein [Spirochaetaceae bacterium]|jgi:membrane protein required for colicin V production|nr:CvpA family protein [Spirochaetaceae bacterium]